VQHARALKRAKELVRPAVEALTIIRLPIPACRSPIDAARPAGSPQPVGTGGSVVDAVRIVGVGAQVTPIPILVRVRAVVRARRLRCRLRREIRAGWIILNLSGRRGRAGQQQRARKQCCRHFASTAR
jgi:hypothetical protein